MDEKNLRALVSLLSDDDNEVLSHVEQKIITLGDTVIPYLEKEWESNFNPLVQKRIEELIHTVQFGQLGTKLKDWKESGGQDLLYGMWLICTYQYPEYEYEKLKSDIEQLYYDAWVDLKITEDLPFERVKQLNYAFFGKLKFAANTKNFHSLNNSMLNVVLETRKGNPISLCVIYMLIAQKLKMPVYGVNLPNLFILTYKTEETQFYINAFNKGLVFTKQDIDNYISHLNLKYNELFYEPCTNVDIIRRVLRNMMVSFEKMNEQEKMDEVKFLLDSLNDETDLGI
ncbi:MAG: transglutaminase-like domain-containing protein [Bacteroidota bacterium]|nr:transglutaminase-like domain-containing protein [Bacteroidota bacterium]